ncbi:MAG: putative membrane protein YeiH [Flavobacteriales bacterium]|jgi:uncharacterized membrane protein YeiH
MSALEILDYVAVFAFSISGISAAAGKKLDLFGGIIIAYVASIGGGTIRDVLLDTDIIWMQDVTYVYIIGAGAAFGMIFQTKIRHLRKSLFLFDSIGIGLYTIIGIQKGFAYGVAPEIALILGVISATFGGVVRDILCNEIPLIFRSEIYATACVIGGIIYIGLTYSPISDLLNLIISGSVIFTIRILAVYKNLKMPVLNDRL